MPLLRRPIRDRLHARLVDKAVEAGYAREDADALAADMAGERPLIDWLMNGGWEKLLETFLKLLDLFAKPAPTA